MGKRIGRIVSLAFFLSLGQYAGAAPVTILLDEFDDGDLATNPGLGNGFASHGQRAVFESGGAMTFNQDAYFTHVTKSIDFFDPFQTGVISQITWVFTEAQINQPSYENRDRFRVGVDGNASSGNHWYGGGFAVELDQHDTPDPTHTSVGRLVDGSTILAEWTYPGVGAGPLTVVLETTDTTYNLLFSVPVDVSSGALTGTMSSKADESWYLGTHAQFVQTAPIDSIKVVQGLEQFSTSIGGGATPAPEPTTLALLALGLLGTGVGRRGLNA